MEELIFFFLATIIVLSALGVVFSENPIHSALFLFVVLLSLAGLYMLLDAPFLAAAQVLIYAGAITVLIIFVVMLTIPHIPSTRILESRQSDAALVVVVLFLFSLLTILRTASWFKPAAKGTPETLTTAYLGEILFKNYILPFELASVVLLVALIGAVYLVSGIEHK